MSTEPLIAHLTAAAEPPEVGPESGREVALRFGDGVAGRRAVVEGAALAMLPWQVRVSVTGRHRGRFVHNFCTCQIKELKPGEGNFGLITNRKGGVVAQMLVECEDERLVLELDARAAEAGLAHLRKHVIADDVRFEPEEGWTVLTLQGPEAGAALERALGEAPGVEADYGWRDVELAGLSARIRKNAMRLGVPGWDVTVAAGDAPAAWDALAAAGATPVGHRDWEIERVLAGVPREDVDLGEADVPLEIARLAPTIDWNKGCYLGQEVICMMSDLGKPRQHLMAVRLPEGALPAPGSELAADSGKAVGRLGTALETPLGPVALAMVKRRYAKAGQQLRLGDASVEVAELPLR